MENRKGIEIQKQIRDSSEELKNTLKSLYDWEKNIKIKEKQMKNSTNDPTFPPIRNKLKQTENVEENTNSVDLIDNNLKEKFKRASEDMKKKYDDIINESPQSIANIEKNKGNECVKLKDYVQGIFFYSKAISLYNKDPIYYSNRAFCFLKLERYQQCIDDCEKALHLDAKFIKVIYRRMLANEFLGNNKLALNDCKLLMKLEPNNKSIKAEYLKIIDNIDNDKIIQSNMPASKEDKDINIILKKFKGETINMWTKQNDTEKIDFVNKPPHKRSKKALKKILIEEEINKNTIDNILNNNNFINNYKINNIDTNKIPDDIVDKLFNNATGESPSSAALINCPNINDLPSTSKGIYNSTLDLCRPLDKKNKSLKVDAIKKNTTTNYIITNEENNNKSITNSDEVPVIPQNSHKFYTSWKELSKQQRFLLLNELSMKKLNINKLIGSSFDSQTLSEILLVASDYFPKNIKDSSSKDNKNVLIHLLNELIQNEQMLIIKLFLSSDDYRCLEIIFDYLLDGDNEIEIEKNIKALKQLFYSK